MSKKQIIREDVGDYQLEWEVSQMKGFYDVTVWRGATCVMEWSYPKVKGCGGLLGHVCFWRPQALVQAKAEEAAK